MAANPRGRAAMNMPAVPTVSVILPTLNRARLLLRSAGSVLRQTFRDLELIVVDDGSTEDIEAAVRSFDDPRLRYLRRERTGGVAAARNTGVQAARGRYLAFQDSDDEWLLNKLERQLADLQPLDETRMSLCGVLRLVRDPASQAFWLLTYPRAHPDWEHGLDRHRVLAAAVTYTQSWLVPRQAVLDAGLFDERLSVWDDWDLLIRLSARLALRTRTEPLVVSARSEGSLSDDPMRFARDLPVILDKYADDLRRHPQDLAALECLHAEWLYRARRFPEARAALRRSLGLKPLPSPAWRLFARTLLESARG